MEDTTRGLELLPLSGDGFLEAYRRADAALARFYAGSPWDEQAYRRKLTEIEGRFDRAAREAIAPALRPTNAEASDKLQQVVEGGGLVVTTGQQAGLFGGPLYTLYKALTGVRLAELLEQRLDRPVLPVFWVASEDHDWAEANHTFVLDRANNLVRIGWPADSGHDARQAVGPSMARRRLGPHVEEALRQLEESLPPSDFAPDLLQTLRTAYTPDATVADAFAALLLELLADVPLALIQASDPVLKARTAGVLRHELEHGAAHEEQLRATTDALRAAGHEPQVPLLSGAEHVSYENGQGRERLVREDGGWHTRASGRRFERDGLLRELESHPERFSPNVLLRPVVESVALPTAAYVAGPSELRYFAQIGCLFQAHGLQMPLVHPRASFAVVESKVRKVLEKFDLDMADINLPTHELTGRIASEQIPDAVQDALSGLRRSLGQGYAALVDAAKQVDPTLKGPIDSARTSGFSELDEVEKRIKRAIKDQNSIALEQVAKVHANLFPADRPQERVLNPHHYLARYGRAFIDRVHREIAMELGADVPGWSGVECGGGKR